MVTAQRNQPERYLTVLETIQAAHNHGDAETIAHHLTTYNRATTLHHGGVRITYEVLHPVHSTHDPATENVEDHCA